MEYKIKLAAALPKGDLDGWDDRELAEEIGEARIQRRDEHPRAAIILYEVKETSTGKNGVITTKLEIARVQPVQTEEGRAAVAALLDDEYENQRGNIQPFELKALSRRAFLDLPRSTSEIDQEEAAAQDLMSPTDELRKHLERVHGRPEAAGMTAEEAEHRHTADHDGDLPEVLGHDREWMGWTRADIEAAVAMAEDEPDDYTTPDGRINAVPDTMDRRVDFAIDDGDDGTPTNDEIEGPDPDYGKDLDDEADENFDGQRVYHNEERPGHP